MKLKRGLRSEGAGSGDLFLRAKEPWQILNWDEGDWCHVLDKLLLSRLLRELNSACLEPHPQGLTQISQLGRKMRLTITASTLLSVQWKFPCFGTEDSGLCSGYEPSLGVLACKMGMIVSTLQ